MSKPKTASTGPAAAGSVRRQSPAPLAALVALPLVLAGCSAVPDWADPSDWFARDEAPTRVAQGEEAQAARSASYPNLASVPDTRPSLTAPAVRAQIRESLAADRAQAEFTGAQLATTEAEAAVAAGSALPVQASAAVADAPPAPQIAAGLVPEAPPAPVQSPEASATPALVTAAGGGELVAIIYFEHGSASLGAEDRRVLGDVAALQRQRGGTIRVVGHASARTGIVEPIQHSLANFEVSLERANIVAAELVELGVPRDQVRAEARGDAQPVYHEFMTTGEAGNRRTEIFLEY